MNLAQVIQTCLNSRGWTPAVLAREAGVKSVQAITRVLKGERKGMHSDNLIKLAPFIYPTPTASPGQAVHLPACELTATSTPGENFPQDAA